MLVGVVEIWAGTGILDLRERIWRSRWSGSSPS